MYTILTDKLGLISHPDLTCHLTSKLSLYRVIGFCSGLVVGIPPTRIVLRSSQDLSVLMGVPPSI